ncbi:uncharacterized protein BX663DRAFT_490140 [Cokeromyces recurvatus]|uniref:uncharacterized protein n=1 Tax=Cokeromyces recurvatus TaxID=90255 RepID=UPI00221FF6D7|nr:uncharacterized protein BX663DRAFT_490140 [Cokeromyces recurvatus]KAI7898283.1 hypothetical protein BX663DRAFT_490140 [Cokeromyces recurvatus]
MSSRMYWNTPILSPFLLVNHTNMNVSNNKNLKRSRSTEFIEKALKRSKPFQDEEPSKSTLNELSIGNSNNIHHNHTPCQSSIPTNSIYPNSMKTISISTRTTSHEPSNDYYRYMNGLLHSIHIERFGDPERRESWWEAPNNNMEIDKMESDNEEYQPVNSILKQAFLQRHQPS